MEVGRLIVRAIDDGAFVLLAAALLAAGIARAAEPAAEPVPPAPEFAAPGAANVASLWEEFFERGNSSSVEALTSLTDVLDDGRCAGSGWQLEPTCTCTLVLTRLMSCPRT